MLTEVSLLAACLVGLLGGVHCVGMCGGIVGALSLGIPERQRRGAARWRFLLSYNLGRLISYTLAGALLGGALAGAIGGLSLWYALSLDNWKRPASLSAVGIGFGFGIVFSCLGMVLVCCCLIFVFLFGWLVG